MCLSQLLHQLLVLEKLLVLLIQYFQKSLQGHLIRLKLVCKGLLEMILKLVCKVLLELVYKGLLTFISCRLDQRVEFSSEECFQLNCLRKNQSLLKKLFRVKYGLKLLSKSLMLYFKIRRELVALLEN